MVPYIDNYSPRGRAILVLEDEQGRTVGYDLDEIQRDVARSLG